MKTKLLIISGLALHFSIVQGQIELGMGAGLSVYRGEIGAHTATSNYVNANVVQGKLSTQGFAKVVVFPGVKLRANLGYSEYASLDKYSRDAFFQQRNLTLSGQILDAGLMLEYYPMPHIPVYLTSGLKYGKVGYSVKNGMGEVVTNSSASNASSYVIPLGVGFDLLSTQRGSVVSFEMVTNKVNGDVLDGMNTAESRNRDFYTSATVNYRIPIYGGNSKIRASRSAACGQNGSMSRNNKYRGLPKHRGNACPSF